MFWYEVLRWCALFTEGLFDVMSMLGCMGVIF